MTCKDCTEAEKRMWHGYMAQCESCRCRRLAASPAAMEAFQYNAPRRLWAAVKTSFPADRIEWARGEIHRWYRHGHH